MVGIDRDFCLVSGGGMRPKCWNGVELRKHFDKCRDAGPNADSDAHSDTDTDTDTNTNTNSNTDADSNTDTNTDADANTDSDADSNTDTDADTIARTHADAGTHADARTARHHGCDQYAAVEQFPRGGNFARHLRGLGDIERDFVRCVRGLG